MKTFLTQSTLARRVNKANRTIQARIQDGTIEPDGVLIVGSKPPGLIFDAERLPSIRKALQGPEVKL